MAGFRLGHGESSEDPERTGYTRSAFVCHICQHVTSVARARMHRLDCSSRERVFGAKVTKGSTGHGLIRSCSTLVAARRSQIALVMAGSTLDACFDIFVRSRYGDLSRKCGTTAPDSLTASCLPIHTHAANSGILAVAAIVRTPPPEGAIRNAGLRARAPYIVHPDRTTSAPKALHLGATSASNRSAHNLRVRISPRIVADRTPGATVEHFNAATAVAFAAGNEANIWVRRWDPTASIRRHLQSYYDFTRV